MAKLKRKGNRRQQQEAEPVERRHASPDTSDTDPELFDASEPRWEPLRIRDHYYGKERQMTNSQQLLGSLEDDYDEDTLQFLTKWKDTDTERWSHDRHDTWEPAENFVESSNAIIKYLERNAAALEDNPQMQRFKLKRDERRTRRISHIKNHAGRSAQAAEAQVEQEEEAEPSPPPSKKKGSKKDKAADASASKKKSKSKQKLVEPDSDQEQERQESPAPEVVPDEEVDPEQEQEQAEEDEGSDNDLPPPIDTSLSSSDKKKQPSATASTEKPKPKPASGKQTAQRKPSPEDVPEPELEEVEAEQQEEEQEAETEQVGGAQQDEPEPQDDQSEAEPDKSAEAGSAGEDEDFNLFDLAPKGVAASLADSSPAPESSPAVATKKPTQQEKEKSGDSEGAAGKKRSSKSPKPTAEIRKDKRKLFRDSDSEASDQEQPKSKQAKKAREASATDSRERSTSKQPSDKGSGSTNGKADEPASEKDRRAQLNKLVNDSLIKPDSGAAANKAAPKANSFVDIPLLEQTLDENGNVQTTEANEAIKQKLADDLVGAKAPHVGEKNVRSYSKVSKMVSRFWKAPRKLRRDVDEMPDSTQSSQAGMSGALERLFTGKKVGIYTIRKPSNNHKKLFDADINAVKLLALANGAAAIGAVTPAMANSSKEVACVFIHCSALSKTGDMERLVDDELLNKLRTESSNTRFVVFGSRSESGFGQADGPVHAVFEPIFETGCAVTFTSDVLLQESEAFDEVASTAHELTPTVRMWVHSGLVSKTREVAEGVKGASVVDVTKKFWSFKVIGSDVSIQLTAGIGASLDDEGAAAFPQESDTQDIEGLDPSLKPLRASEEVRELSRVTRNLRIKYFKVRRWIVVGTPQECTKAANETNKTFPSVEFMDLQALKPIIAEFDVGGDEDEDMAE